MKEFLTSKPSLTEWVIDGLLLEYNDAVDDLGGLEKFEAWVTFRG